MFKIYVYIDKYTISDNNLDHEKKSRMWATNSLARPNECLNGSRSKCLPIPIFNSIEIRENRKEEKRYLYMKNDFRTVLFLVPRVKPVECFERCWFVSLLLLLIFFCFCFLFLFYFLFISLFFDVLRWAALYSFAGNILCQ